MQLLFPHKTQAPFHVLPLPGGGRVGVGLSDFLPFPLHLSQLLQGSSLAFLTIFLTAVCSSPPLQSFAIHIPPLDHSALSSCCASHFSVLSQACSCHLHCFCPLPSCTLESLVCLHTVALVKYSSPRHYHSLSLLPSLSLIPCLAF